MALQSATAVLYYYSGTVKVAPNCCSTVRNCLCGTEMSVIEQFLRLHYATLCLRGRHPPQCGG